MGLLSGINQLFGGDPQGEYYKAPQLDNKGTKSLAEMLDAARSGGVNTAGTGLVNGGSLSDALKGLSPDQVSALASSPVFGNIVASQQAQSDPLLSGLIGKGGSMDRALADEKNLDSQGFKLQPQDVEAYGQASGNIARMFGQSENSLASALANRGLAAAPSGAAGAAFSGLQGNKNEQLGQMQMQIANERMNNTMQRLQQTRQYLTSMGNLGQNAENNAFSHNMEGTQNRENLANNLSNQERSDYNAQAEQNQAEMTSKLANKRKNLGDALSNGIYQGVQGGAKAGVTALAGKIGIPAQTDDSNAGVSGGKS